MVNHNCQFRRGGEGKRASLQVQEKLTKKIASSKCGKSVYGSCNITITAERREGGGVLNKKLIVFNKIAKKRVRGTGIELI